jgi:hypothetical protein
MLQSPLPVQATRQVSVQFTSQLPLPLHSTNPSAPTSAAQLPELVHSTWQSPPHAKLQLPEPAHWRSQSAVHSMSQSPEAARHDAWSLEADAVATVIVEHAGLRSWGGAGQLAVEPPISVFAEGLETE